MLIRKLGKEILKYALGAVMYCPADNGTIADNLLSGKLGRLSTLILCLEDSILPQNLGAATRALGDTLRHIAGNAKDISQLPLIFIRVRDPQHLEDTYARFHEFSGLVSGFVLPKYDTTVARGYSKVIHKINVCHKFWYLPILESESIITENRLNELVQIKKALDMESSILGVLVGGNDMCRYFGIRRNPSQNIYQIGVVRDVLSDIVRILGINYVINGPVWESFSGPGWESGLRKEVELDKLNGFVGKACIHPEQVRVVQDALKVDRFDYEDAMDLVNWESASGVKKSRNSGRMNEIATNLSWAEKIKALGDIYGVRG